MQKKIEERAGNEKPPAAYAGGGLDAVVLLDPVNQALLPACELWLLIRRSGLHAAPGTNEQQSALARGVCMTLKQVDQSGAGRVKRMAAIMLRSFLPLAAWDAHCDERDCACGSRPPGRMPH